MKQTAANNLLASMMAFSSFESFSANIVIEGLDGLDAPVATEEGREVKTSEILA